MVCILVGAWEIIFIRCDYDIAVKSMDILVHLKRGKMTESEICSHGKANR